jgi:hypothetical protein
MTGGRDRWPLRRARARGARDCGSARGDALDDLRQLLNFTGLLSCTQSCSAISRKVPVDMSPVRMMTGIGDEASPAASR